MLINFFAQNQQLKNNIMKLEKLSKEQTELMFTTSQEWINTFNNTKRINEKQFEKGIKWLYEDLLKIKNPKVLYCESWLECLLTISVLKELEKNTVGNTVGDMVWNAVEDMVGDTVLNTVGDMVRHTVGNTVWNTVEDMVWDAVEDMVGDTVWNTVLNTVGDAVEDMVWDAVGDTFSEYSLYSGIASNCGWVSFYDYFEKIGVLNNSDFKKYKDLIRAGAFQVYEYENVVFAIQPPTKMERNEQQQLNSITEMAFSWNDGYGFYYVNGLNLKEELFNNLRNNTYTITDFAQEKNEEVKSAVISFIQQKNGEEGVYRFFKESLQEIDTYVDKKESVYLAGTTGSMNIGVYTLFKGQINNTDVAYVRCYCPSSDRMFFLGVEPSNTNAKDSIASLYQVPKILSDNIVSINRQGEIFSTVFDENTTKKLKNNEFSKKDLNNYVSLSGNEYFSKIRFEY